MNPLIERYIYDVIRRIPERDRTWVEKELLAQIAGVLGENPSDEDVTNVLNSLGSPQTRAEQFRSNKRYLISPAVYDEYWAALRVVAVILFTVILIASAVKYFVEDPPTMTVFSLVSTMLPAILICAVTAVVTAFVSVTLVFVCIDRFGKNSKEKAWSVKDLPRMPYRASRISRHATLISMIFSVIFNAVIIVVMLRFSRYLALYSDFTPTVPLFHPDILSALVPYVVALAVGALVVNAMKLYYGHWNFTLAFFNSLYRVASAAFVIYFLNFTGVFNQEFVSGISGMLSLNLDTVTAWFQRGLLILTAIILFVTVWDVAKCFYLAYRSESRSSG